MNSNYYIPKDAEPYIDYLTEKPRSPKEIAAFLSSFTKNNIPYTPQNTTPEVK